MPVITQRSEILFLYDAKQCNPNGDPMDANRPRIDEETGKCLVTDVRLKRTVRDYLFEKGYNGETGGPGDIFIREEDGKPVTGSKRAESYRDKKEYLEKFIDVRLFGGVSAPKKAAGGKKKAEKSGEEAEGEEEHLDTGKTFHFTGPVQFGMGKSLNVVRVNFIKGTGAFTTSETSIQKTFREEYNIAYGLIGFHGVVNENAAKYVGTTEQDIEQLVDGLWNGTKSLLTRSKKGHMPRLLIKIDYSEKGFFIGDLLERLRLLPVEGKTEEGYDDVADFALDVSGLNAKLRQYAGKIASVSLWHDDRLVLTEPIVKP